MLTIDIDPIDPRKVPADPRERAQWIIGQLKLRGLSLRGLARLHGWKPSNVSGALRIPNYPAEKAIAKALGTTPAVVFPDRYDRKGRRLHRVVGLKDSRGSAGGNVEGVEAA